MSTNGSRPSDVREALVVAAVELTEIAGPDQVSLREVQRRVGVSPAAAYKHYRDREALLAAVGRRASALLADALHLAMAREEGARDRFRAGCRAYVDFARDNPGLFRSILLTDETVEQIADPPAEGTGAAGLGSYELLQESLRELPPATADDAPLVWAACHGLAVLLLDGPLRQLPPEAQDALIDHEVDLLMAGLAVERSSRSVG